MRINNKIIAGWVDYVNKKLSPETQISYEKDDCGYVITNKSGSNNYSGRGTASEALIFLQGILTALENLKRK